MTNELVKYFTPPILSCLKSNQPVCLVLDTQREHRKFETNEDEDQNETMLSEIMSTPPPCFPDELCAADHY